MPQQLPFTSGNLHYRERRDQDTDTVPSVCRDRNVRLLCWPACPYFKYCAAQCALQAHISDSYAVARDYETGSRHYRGFSSNHGSLISLIPTDICQINRVCPH